MSNRSQILSSRKSSRTDYVFCLDDSGSITNEDFKEMCHASEDLITGIEGDNRFAVVTFHSNADIVSGWSVDKAMCVGPLWKYTRKKGGTNTEAGLMKCDELFKKRRPKVDMKLILITDGNSDKSPEDIAMRLRLEGILILVVGVGSGVNENQAKKICNIGCFFKVDNFLHLKSFLKSIGGQSDLVMKDYALEMFPQRYPSNYPDRLDGGVLVIAFELENKGTKEIPAGTTLYFPEAGKAITSTTYVLNEVIRCNGSHNGYLRFRFNANLKDFISIPQNLKYAINLPSGLNILTGELPLQSDWLIGPLFSFMPQNIASLRMLESFNFMMFGVAGSGKSLFINRLMTALSKSIHFGAVFGGGAGHTTKEIQRFRVTCPEVKVTLMDTWGLDDKNYSESILTAVLKGDIPPEYTMAMDQNRETIKFDKVVLECYSRKVHCLLMFVPVGILKQADLFLKMKQNYHYATSVNLNPIIIVTRMDTILESERNELRELLAREWKVPESSLFLIKNYTEEKEKVWDIDMSSLQILLVALRRAQDFATYHCRIPTDQPPLVHASPIQGGPPQGQNSSPHVQNATPDNMSQAAPGTPQGPPQGPAQGQWGQPGPQQGQWGAPQGQWGPPSQGQWAQPQGQWGQSGPQGQWGPPSQGQWGPPTQGQWGPPAQGQWGPPPQGQWGQSGPPSQGQWGPPSQGQWGPPSQGQWGPQSQGQWGPPQQQGQWGQSGPPQQQGQWGPPQGQWGPQGPNGPSQTASPQSGPPTESKPPCADHVGPGRFCSNCGGAL